MDKLSASSEWTNSAGITVQIKAIPRGKRELLHASRAEIKPPTYEYTNPAGDKSILEHDETTLKTEQDKLAWAAYLMQKMARDIDFTTAFMRLLIYEGTSIPDADYALDSEWARKMQAIGLPIKEDKYARLWDYVTGELFVTDDDAPDFMQAVLSLGNRELEAARQLADTFRDGIQRNTDSGQTEDTGQVEDNG